MNGESLLMLLMTVVLSHGLLMNDPSGMSGTTSHGARNRGRQDAPPQREDSVRVVLFASRRVQHVEISSASGMTLDGDRRRGTVSIRTVKERLEVDGVQRVSVTIGSTGTGGLQLTSQNVTRRARGRVTISPVGGDLRMVATIPLRDYLASALVSETSRNDPMEYLVAMSALQRNYLAEHPSRHPPDADVCDNTHCQRSDMTEVQGRAYMAVDRAAGIRLQAVGGGHPCYYSVNCGGSTLTPSQIWNHAEPGYSNVRCTHCRSSAYFRWGRAVAASPEVDRIMRGAAGRTPFIDDNFKIRLGRVAGFNKVLSNTIDRIERRGATWRLYGRGFGHRVGLCQEGGRGLAMKSWSAVAILRYYFPLATVSIINE